MNATLSHSLYSSLEHEITSLQRNIIQPLDNHVSLCNQLVKCHTLPMNTFVYIQIALDTSSRTASQWKIEILKLCYILCSRSNAHALTLLPFITSHVTPLLNDYFKFTTLPPTSPKQVPLVYKNKLLEMYLNIFRVCTLYPKSTLDSQTINLIMQCLMGVRFSTMNTDISSLLINILGNLGLSTQSRALLSCTIRIMSGYSHSLYTLERDIARSFLCRVGQKIRPTRVSIADRNCNSATEPEEKFTIRPRKVRCVEQIKEMNDVPLEHVKSMVNDNARIASASIPNDTTLATVHVTNGFSKFSPVQSKKLACIEDTTIKGTDTPIVDSCALHAIKETDILKTISLQDIPEELVDIENKLDEDSDYEMPDIVID